MDDRHDLTQGVIWKKLIVYFLPIVAGTLFQQLYNAVDALIVGKFVGTQALAAVGGSSSALVQLVVGFFASMSGGAGVVVAHHIGAGDKKMVREEIHTGMTFSAIIGVILGIVMIVLSPTVLRWLCTPVDTMREAVLYTRIYFSGSIFLLLFNMGSGILRAMGDSRRPFWYLAISCVLNIVLDLFFVIVLHMGVAGVAWATVIAQAISTGCVLVDLCRKNSDYQLRLSQLGIRWDVLKNMLRLGVSAGVQSAMYSFSNLILQIGINTLSTVVVASWSMSGKLDGVYWATAGAFGTAVTNFVGQNYGAGRMDRVHGCFKTGMKLFSAMTVSFSIVILLLAKPLLPLFTDDPAVRSTTWTILSYFVPLYILWTVIEILSGVLRGVGDTVKPVVIVGLGVCLLRIVWILTVFPLSPTLRTISLCYPISWVITDIVLYIYYRKGCQVFKYQPKGA